MMAIAVTFYVAVILASLIRPYWGLVGLIASLLIRFQDRYPAIETIPTFQLLAISIVIGMFANADQVASPKLRQDWLIGYFVGYVFLGILLMSPGNAIEQMIGLLSSVLIYFFVTRLINNHRQLMILLISLSAVTVGLGVESLFAYYTNEASEFVNPITGRLQGLGYYANANEFGKLMCTAIPFVAIFLFRGNLLIRLAAIAAIGAMVLVIGETLSRTCFVVLAIVIGSAIMLRGKGKVFRKAAITGVAGLALLVGQSYLPGPLQERAQSILEYSEDKSFQGRLRAWDQGFLMISWYPVFGVGIGQWTEYHGRAPHNSYVQVLAETGIPGFILFISVVWVSFRGFLTYLAKDDLPKNSDLRAIGLAIASSYAGYLFYILLGNQGYSPWTYFYFGLCGTFTYLVSLEETDHDLASQPDPSQKAT